MTFSISLPSILKRTISQNILGVLYEALLGLGIIMEDNVLKCDSQCSRFIHTLAILIKLLTHVLSLIMTLRCFHNNLSSSRVEVLLHFVIELLNSLTKKDIQIMVVLDQISSNML